MKIDNTMLKLFEDCPLKYDTRINGEWTSRNQSAPLGYGGAVHEGLKAWYQGWIDGLSPISRAELAVQAIEDNWPEFMPADDYRTMTKAQELMISYIKEYPQEPFKILQVEVPFLFELGRWILHCGECGRDNPPWFTSTDGQQYPIGDCICGKPLEPIEYGGIFDTIVQYGAGSQSVLYILEHKTTSQLGPTYFQQFDIDNQITGYIWGGMQVTGKLIGGANINALCTTRSGNISFKRGMQSRNPTQLEQWKDDVATTCNEIARAQRNGFWRKSTGHCQNKYGMCTYHSVHVLSEPNERRRRLETDFRKEKWDFERRDDLAVAE